jgi:hypothetical protein
LRVMVARSENFNLRLYRKLPTNSLFKHQIYLLNFSPLTL